MIHCLRPTTRYALGLLLLTGASCAGVAAEDQPAPLVEVVPPAIDAPAQPPEVSGPLADTPEPPPALAPAAAPATGVAFAPAIALVTQVPLGSPVNLASDANQPFIVDNRGPDTADITLRGVAPVAGGMPLWEYGYEPIPDPSWVRCAPDSVGLGIGMTQVEVIIAIPDEPRYAGRKFVAGVRLGLGSSEQFGTGLALCARMLIETQDRSQADAGGGWLATVPGTVLVGEPAGTTGVRLLALRNGTDAPLALICRRLAEVEPRATKRADYHTVPATEDSWLTLPEPFALAAGAGTTLRLPFTIPADAKPGSYEDLLLFGEADQWAIVDAARVNPAERSLQPRLMLVRIRYDIPAP
jgi:hypothetical protein